MSATNESPPSDAKAAKRAKELNAAEKLYEASTRIRQAQGDLEKLKAQYSPDHAAWAQCETIDDHLFEALKLLG